MFNQTYSLLSNKSIPDFTAFIKGEQQISFSNFKDDVEKLAYQLKNLKDESVIIYIQDDLYTFYKCFMASLHIGKNIILPAFLTSENSDDLLNLSKTLLTTSEITNNDFNIINPHTLTLDKQEALKEIDVENTYIFFFTSGSTSKPKTIKKAFKTISLETALLYNNEKEKLTQNPTVISSTQPNHIYGMLWRFLLPLSCSITQDLDLILFPEEIVAKQEKYEKISFITTPSFMNQLVSYKNQYQFKDNCISIYSSGSLLSEKTSSAMFEIFDTSPLEIFGSTESGSIAYRQQKNGPTWHIANDIELKLDEDTCLIVNSPRSYQNPYKMSDSVTFTDEKNFILNGRIDRLVKIAEKRISLPDMEQKLETHKFIKQAYALPLEDEKRTILGSVITLTEEGKNFLKTNSKLTFTSNIKQYLSQYFEAVALPRKIRIVEKIPTNAQGKFIRNNIAKLFHSKITEPIIENLEITQTTLKTTLTFLKDAEYFKGHFKDYPILPGVIQIHFVFHFLKTYFNENPHNYTVSKLKFTNLILPQKEVDFTLEKTQPNEYSFTYKKDEKNFSSGKIILRGKNV